MENQEELLLQGAVAISVVGVTGPTGPVRDDDGIPDSAKPTKD